ncbi:group-specific protein [Aquibacillus sediminis]|uniref:group-specific protein n=1 Tax=Aquibacillus sediminis TaxID=2574734 RepID=UPI0011084B9E|nr:group-specific protein [Aquibacillus sediminis]
MGKCNIDHSLEDVRQKLNDQQAFLPQNLYQEGKEFLGTKPSQEVLNTFFHLLKKYDLVTDEERHQRDQEIAVLVR